MKPPVDTIKVSSKGRDVLIRAKSRTGLGQWNELLRWAFCISLSNPSEPSFTEKFDQGIEPIEWKTFAGEHDEIYSACFWLRASQQGINLEDKQDVAAYFRAHMERGVRSLRPMKSISALMGIKLGDTNDQGRK